MQHNANPHGSYLLNIIAVEDDLVTAESIKQIFKKMKCHVDMFSTGEDLLEKINSNYDLALLDIELPGMNGFKVAEVIRQKFNGMVSIPIVILSSNKEDENIKRAQEIGIDGFLRKPLSQNNCNYFLSYYKCKHHRSI